MAGDIVYVKGRAIDPLDCNAIPIIFQVIKIKPDYTLVLRCNDGRVINDHVRNTTPWYLPNVIHEYDPARVRPEANQRCEVCHHIDSPDTMFLCDGV